VEGNQGFVPLSWWYLLECMLCVVFSHQGQLQCLAKAALPPSVPSVQVTVSVLLK